MLAAAARSSQDAGCRRRHGRRWSGRRSERIGGRRRGRRARVRRRGAGAGQIVDALLDCRRSCRRDSISNASSTSSARAVPGLRTASAARPAQVAGRALGETSCDSAIPVSGCGGGARRRLRRVGRRKPSALAAALPGLDVEVAAFLVTQSAFRSLEPRGSRTTRRRAPALGLPDDVELAVLLRSRR